MAEIGSVDRVVCLLVEVHLSRSCSGRHEAVGLACGSGSVGLAADFIRIEVRLAGHLGEIDDCLNSFVLFVALVSGDDHVGLFIFWDHLHSRGCRGLLLLVRLF